MEIYHQRKQNMILKLRPFSTKLQFHFVDMSHYHGDMRPQSCTSLLCCEQAFFLQAHDDMSNKYMYVYPQGYLLNSTNI